MDMLHAHMPGTDAVGIYDSDFPELPGSEAICVFWVKANNGNRGGAALFSALTGAVEQRGIPVHWGSAAQHLIYEDGEVRGVRGVRDGKPFAAKARRGVVLTCGCLLYTSIVNCQNQPLGHYHSLLISTCLLYTSRCV